MTAARAPVAGLVVAALLLAAGCTTVVAGSPQAVTTDAGAATVTPAGTTSTTPRSGTTSPSSPTAAARSAIRPMPPLSTPSTPIRTSTRTTGTTVTRIAGVDLDAVVSTLRRAHVAGIGSSADLDAVRSLVDAARADGLRLSVVSIGTAIGNDTTSQIAQRIFDRIGGTVVVLSPALVSVRSDQLTAAQRDAAVRSAASAHDDQQAVSRFIDAVLGSAAGSGPTPAHSSSTVPRTVGGVPIDAIVAALGHDHIAIGPGVHGVTARRLAGPVQTAWEHDLRLSVAVLATDPSGHLYSVADAIKDHTGGTVVVVSPKRYAIASDSFSDRRLQDALNAGQNATSAASFVTAVVTSLLG